MKLGLVFGVGFAIAAAACGGAGSEGRESPLGVEVPAVSPSARECLCRVDSHDYACSRLGPGESLTFASGGWCAGPAGVACSPGEACYLLESSEAHDIAMVREGVAR
jgi:hypothetical protein